MNGRILVVDDEEGLREALAEKLRHSGHEVETAESAEEALSGLSRFEPDLIVTDLMMPGLSGLELLEKVQETVPSVDVVVMTGHEDMSSAVDAMKAGAFDYLVKPVKLARVDDLVNRCLKEQALNREAREEADSSPARGAAGRVVGRDPRMIEIYKMIGVLARNRATVLIRGETGTGKEMVARAIHDNSAHADEPFVAVNCTALSETLLESELFGHVKGSFTGAVSARRGYFEMAGSGTIFLDEIGELPKSMQAKLLRVLESGEIRRVGDNEPFTVDVRVVCATHRDLHQMVEDGEFREDLMFRINTFEIEVPALRARISDIPLLASHLLQRFRPGVKPEDKLFTQEAEQVLVHHVWPGNVRELANVIEHAAILCDELPIDDDHLPQRFSQRQLRQTLRPMSLRELEMQAIHESIERHEGNKQAAAAELGISLKTLYNRLNQEADVKRAA